MKRGVRSNARPVYKLMHNEITSTRSEPAANEAVLYLPDHISLCRTREDIVGLDLKRNRYFCLGPREARALQTLARDFPSELRSEPDTEVDANVTAMASALVQAQLLTPCPEQSLQLDRQINPPLQLRASDELQENSHLRLLYILAAVLALVWARQALASRTLYDVAVELSQPRSPFALRSSVPDAVQMLRLSQAFRQVRPYLYSAKDRCLLHALTLRRFLWYFRAPAKWIIGVRTRPWAAHSWVQHDRTLLDGRPDEVCEYTPILRV